MSTFCAIPNVFPIDLVDVKGINTTALMRDIQNTLNSGLDPISNSAAPRQRPVQKRIFLDSYQALDDFERRLKPVEEVVDLLAIEQELDSNSQLYEGENEQLFENGNWCKLFLLISLI